MDMIQRLYNAVMGKSRRIRMKLELEDVLRKAMPYYDSDYYGDWSMDVLIKRILEITDGKVS